MHKRLSLAEAQSEIVTQFAPMQAVLALVERVARSDSAVLILGESGTGKELVARMLHRLSHRVTGPLVDINCAAIPDALVESELFGHERGAHAEASTRKLGLFELANGGTIFMDEIGALDPKVQGKLLRALELGTFYRVGGTQKVRSDIRVVAASNQDLAQRVANGTFRSDLYYRINTISITLPPLRERNVDIPLLARHFLENAPDGVVAHAQSGGDRRPAGVSMARQRARAAERHRARRAGRDGDRRFTRATSRSAGCRHRTAAGRPIRWRRSSRWSASTSRPCFSTRAGTRGERRRSSGSRRRRCTERFASSVCAVRTSAEPQRS